MSFKIGQNVIVLDTAEHKPAGNATILEANEDQTQYNIDYIQYGSQKKEQFLISANRLAPVLSDTIIRK